MDKQSLYFNSNLAALRAQVDALVSVLDENTREKYNRKLVESVATINEKYENMLDPNDFKEFKNLVSEMALSNR